MRGTDQFQRGMLLHIQPTGDTLAGESGMEAEPLLAAQTAPCHAGIGGCHQYPGQGCEVEAWVLAQPCGATGVEQWEGVQASFWSVAEGEWILPERFSSAKPSQSPGQGAGFPRSPLSPCCWQF